MEERRGLNRDPAALGKSHHRNPARRDARFEQTIDLTGHPVRILGDVGALGSEIGQYLEPTGPERVENGLISVGPEFGADGAGPLFFNDPAVEVNHHGSGRGLGDGRSGAEDQDDADEEWVAAHFERYLDKLSVIPLHQAPAMTDAVNNTHGV